MSGPRTTTTQSSNQSSQQDQREQGSYSNTANVTRGFSQVPGVSSPDIDALRDFDFSSDPRIGYTFARAMQRNQDSYANPLGANTTPGLRDATLRAGNEDLAQQAAQAYAVENYGRQGQQYQQRYDVARMTAPRIEETSTTSTATGESSGETSGTSNTSGSGTGVQSTSPGTAGYIQSGIAGAATVGAAML